MALSRQQKERLLDAYQKGLAACMNFVLERSTGKDQFFNQRWDQSIWRYTHSAIFLTYLHRVAGAFRSAGQRHH